jgi:hypothetical protein
MSDASSMILEDPGTPMSTVGYGVVAYDQSERSFHRDPIFVLMTATAR